MMFVLYAWNVWVCLIGKHYEMHHTISQYPLFQKSQNNTLWCGNTALSAYWYNWSFHKVANDNQILGESEKLYKTREKMVVWQLKG